jgi:hypothetical protein
MNRNRRGHTEDCALILGIGAGTVHRIVVQVVRLERYSLAHI